MQDSYITQSLMGYRVLQAHFFSSLGSRKWTFPIHFHTGVFNRQFLLKFYNEPMQPATWCTLQTLIWSNNNTCFKNHHNQKLCVWEHREIDSHLHHLQCFKGVGRCLFWFPDC